MTANVSVRYLEPLADRVVVKRTETTAVEVGGLIMPDAGDRRREKAVEAQVVWAGRGKVTAHPIEAVANFPGFKGWAVVPMAVRTGDVVLVRPDAGWDATIDGMLVTILTESDILAVVREHKFEKEEGESDVQAAHV